MSIIVVQAYWDSDEDQRESIFDIVNGRRYKWSRNGFSVGPEDYRVDDKGYFMEFEAARSNPDGSTMRYWVVGARLHRLPGAVVVVSGNAPDKHEEFMRESLTKVVGLLSLKFGKSTEATGILHDLIHVEVKESDRFVLVMGRAGFGDAFWENHFCAHLHPFGFLGHLGDHGIIFIEFVGFFGLLIVFGIGHLDNQATVVVTERGLLGVIRFEFLVAALHC